MIAEMARNWWVFLVRGILAILFGILAIIWPLATVGALVLIFGAYALVDGIFDVIAGLSSIGENRRWWVLLLEGLVGIAVGLMTFFWPSVTAIILLYFIAAWAIVTGILEIIAAIQLRRVITGEWAMILAGIVSVLFGLYLFLFPGAGALSVVFIIGVYAILFGILLVILAFRLRGLANDASTTGAARY